MSYSDDFGEASEVAEVARTEGLRDADGLRDLERGLDDVDPVGVRRLADAEAVVRECS